MAARTDDGGFQLTVPESTTLARDLDNDVLVPFLVCPGTSLQGPDDSLLLLAIFVWIASKLDHVCSKATNTKALYVLCLHLA